MRVKNYLFDESPFENSLEMESDFVSQLCVHSVTGNWRVTR